MPIDNFSNIEEIDQALIQKDTTNKQLQGNSNSNSNSNINNNSNVNNNSNINNNKSKNTNLFDEEFNPETQSKEFNDNNDINLFDDLLNPNISNSNIDDLLENNSNFQSKEEQNNKSNKNIDTDKLKEQQQLQNQELLKNKELSQNDQGNIPEVFSPELFEELEKSKRGVKDFTPSIFKDKLDAKNESDKKNIDAYYEQQKIAYFKKLDKDLLEEAQNIQAIGSVGDITHEHSGVAENRAYRNFLVSRGVLDKGLADYYNFQEEQRSKYLRSQFNNEVLIPLKQSLQEHQLFNQYEKQRHIAQINIEKEYRKILSEIHNNIQHTQTYSPIDITNDYLQISHNRLRSMYVTTDISVLNSYEGIWNQFKSGFNNFQYSIVEPILDRLSLYGSDVGDFLYTSIGLGHHTNTMEERRELFVRKQAYNARVAELGGASGHFLSYGDLLGMKGTGLNGIPVTEFLRKGGLEFVQSIPEYALLIGLNIISGGFGGTLAKLGSWGTKLTRAATASKMTKLGMNFSQASRNGFLLSASLASKILANKEFTSLLTFISLDSALHYNKQRYSKLNKLLEKGYSLEQAWNESELTFKEIMYLFAYSLLDKAELSTLLALTAGKSIANKGIANAFFGDSKVGKILGGIGEFGILAQFEGLVEGIQGLTEELGSSDHDALRDEVNLWETFTENYWGGLIGGGMLIGGAKGLGIAKNALFSRGNQENIINADALGIDVRSSNANNLLNSLNNTSHESRGIFQRLYDGFRNVLSVDNLTNNYFSNDPDFVRETHNGRNIGHTDIIGGAYTRFQESNGSFDEMNSRLDNDINSLNEEQKKLKDQQKSLEQRIENSTNKETTKELKKELKEVDKKLSETIDKKNQAKIQKALINDTNMKASLQALFVYMSYTNANQVNISEANQETLNRLIDKAQNNPEAFTEQDLETIKNILKESNTNNNPNVNIEQNTTTNSNQTNANTNTANKNNNNNNDDDNNGGNPPTSSTNTTNGNLNSENSSVDNTTSITNQAENSEAVNNNTNSVEAPTSEDTITRNSDDINTPPYDWDEDELGSWDDVSEEDKKKFKEFEKAKEEIAREREEINKRYGSSRHTLKRNRNKYREKDENDKKEEEIYRQEEKQKLIQTNKKQNQSILKPKTNKKIEEETKEITNTNEEVFEDFSDPVTDKVIVNIENEKSNREKYINKNDNRRLFFILLSSLNIVFDKETAKLIFKILTTLNDTMKIYNIFSKKYRSVTLDFETGIVVAGEQIRIDCVTLLDNVSLERTIYISKNIYNNIKSEENFEKRIKELEKKLNAKIKVVDFKANNNDFIKDIKEYGKVIAHSADFDVVKVINGQYGINANIDIEYADTRFAKDLFGTNDGKLSTLAKHIGDNKINYKEKNDDFKEPTSLSMLEELLIYNVKDVDITYQLSMNLFKNGNIEFAPSSTLPILMMFIAQQSNIKKDKARTKNASLYLNIKKIFSDIILNLFLKYRVPFSIDNAKYTNSDMIKNILESMDDTDKYKLNKEEQIIRDSFFKQYEDSFSSLYSIKVMFNLVFNNRNLKNALAKYINNPLNHNNEAILKDELKLRLMQLGVDINDDMLNELIIELKKIISTSDNNTITIIKNFTTYMTTFMAYYLNITDKSDIVNIQNNYIYTKLSQPELRYLFDQLFTLIIRGNFDDEFLAFTTIESIDGIISEIQKYLDSNKLALHQEKNLIIDALLLSIKNLPISKLLKIDENNSLLKTISNLLSKIIYKGHKGIKTNNGNIYTAIKPEFIPILMLIGGRKTLQKIITDAFKMHRNFSNNGIGLPINDDILDSVIKSKDKNKLQQLIEEYEPFFLAFTSALLISISTSETFTGGIYKNQITLDQILDNVVDILRNTFYINKNEAFSQEDIKQIASSILEIIKSNIKEGNSKLINTYIKTMYKETKETNQETGKKEIIQKPFKQGMISVHDFLLNKFKKYIINPFKKNNISSSSFKSPKKYWVDKKVPLRDESGHLLRNQKHEVQYKYVKVLHFETAQEAAQNLYDRTSKNTFKVNLANVLSMIPRKFNYHYISSILRLYGSIDDIEEINKEEYDLIRAKGINEERSYCFKQALNVFSFTINGKTKYFKGNFITTRNQIDPMFPIQRVKVLDKYSSMHKALLFYYKLLQLTFPDDPDYNVTINIDSNINIQLPEWEELDNVINEINNKDSFYKGDTEYKMNYFYIKYYNTPNSNERAFSKIAIFDGQQLPIFRGTIINANAETITREELVSDNNHLLDYKILEAMGVDFTKKEEYNEVVKENVKSIKNKIRNREYGLVDDPSKTIEEQVEEQLKKDLNFKSDNILKKDVSKTLALQTLIDVYFTPDNREVEEIFDTESDGISMGITLGLQQNINNAQNRVMLRMCGINIILDSPESFTDIIESKERTLQIERERNFKRNNGAKIDLREFFNINKGKIHNIVAEALENIINQLDNDIAETSFLKNLINHNKKDFGKLFSQSSTYGGSLETSLKHMISDFEFYQYLDIESMHIQTLINKFNNGEIKGIKDPYITKKLKNAMFNFQKKALGLKSYNESIAEYMIEKLLNNIFIEENIGKLNKKEVMILMSQNVENFHTRISETIAEKINESFKNNDLEFIFNPLKQSNKHIKALTDLYINCKIMSILKSPFIIKHIEFVNEAFNNTKDSIKNKRFEINDRINTVLDTLINELSKGIEITIPLFEDGSHNMTFKIPLLLQSKEYNTENTESYKLYDIMNNIFPNILSNNFSLLTGIKSDNNTIQINKELPTLKNKLQLPIVGMQSGQLIESLIMTKVNLLHPDKVGTYVYDSLRTSVRDKNEVAKTFNTIIGKDTFIWSRQIIQQLTDKAQKEYNKLVPGNILIDKLVNTEQYKNSHIQRLLEEQIRKIESNILDINSIDKNINTLSNFETQSNNVQSLDDSSVTQRFDEKFEKIPDIDNKRRGSSQNRYKDNAQNNETNQQYDGYDERAGNLTKLSYEQQISALEEQKQKALAIGDESLVETIDKEIKFLKDLKSKGIEVKVYIGDNIQDDQGEMDRETNKIYIGQGKDAFAHELGHFITDTVDKYDHMPEVAKVKQEFSSLYERVKEIYAKLYEKFNGDKEKIAEVMGISVEKLDYIFNNEDGLAEFIQHAMTDVAFAKWLNKIKVRTQNNKPANLFQRLLRAITNFFRMMSKNPTILEAMQKNFTKAIEVKLLTQKAESLVDSRAYISENYEAIVQRIMSEAYGNNINTTEGYIRQGYQKAGKIISDYVDGKITTRQFWDRMYRDVGYGALIIIANMLNVNLLTSKKPIFRAIGKFTQSLLFDSNLLLNTKTSNEFLNAFISDSILKKQIGRDVNRIVSIYKDVAETIMRNSEINSDDQDKINKFIIKDRIFMAFDGLKTIEKKQKMLEMINSILTKDNRDISDITSDITNQIESIINNLKIDNNLKKKLSQFIINSAKEDLSRAFILKQRALIHYTPSAKGLLQYINSYILNTNKIIDKDVVSELAPLINQLVVLNGIALNTSYTTEMKQTLSNLLTNTETNTNRKNSFKSTMFNITDLAYKAFDNNRSDYYNRYDFSYSENMNNNISFEHTTDYKNAKRLLQLGYAMQIVDDKGNLKEIRELPKNRLLFNKLVKRTDTNYKKFNLTINNKGGIIFKKNNFYSESFDLLEIDVDNQVLFKANTNQNINNSEFHKSFFNARTNSKYKNKRFNNIKESLNLREAMFKDNGKLRGLRKITQQPNSIANNIGDIVYRNSSNSMMEETTNSRFETIKEYTKKVKKEKISPKLSVVIYDKNWSKEKKEKELSKRFSKTELVILNQQGFFDHQDKLYIPIEAESIIQAKWKSAIVYKWMRDSDKKILNYTYRLTRMSHEFIKKITSEFKTTITERFPNIIFGNILFNTISMFSLGMSPRQIYQYNKEAFDSITSYIDASHRLYEIQTKLLQIKDTNSVTYESLKIQEKALQQKINNNMIHKYKGLQTNISEETSRNDLVNNIIDNLIDINRLKRGADILFFTRRSPQFKFFSQVNLWGDVMGRLALFNYYAKERNMNINNAINESNRFFVDYNKPFTNVILRLADELGLSIFIRYNTNMKGVIAEGLANPKTRINNMILLGLYMFGTAGFDQTIYHTLFSQGYNIWAGKGLYNSLNRWAGLQRVVS